MDSSDGTGANCPSFLLYEDQIHHTYRLLTVCKRNPGYPLRNNSVHGAKTDSKGVGKNSGKKNPEEVRKTLDLPLVDSWLFRYTVGHS